MIFDSPEMEELRHRFESQNEYRIPQVVVLDRLDRFANERKYLESLMSAAPSSKHRDWIGRFVNEDDKQHLGAWFEMMLYGWLQDVGHVVVAPAIEQDDPDFALMVDGRQVIFEAHASILNESEREKQNRMHEVLWALHQIQKPYVVKIEAYTIGDPIDLVQFAAVITRWLDSAPDQPHVYEDLIGNRINLSAQHYPNLDRVEAQSPLDFVAMTGNVLKAPLKEKAAQHRRIRRANYPYVIALLLESWKLSDEEVAEAWIGKLEYVYDSNSGELLDQRLDRSGIHYWKREIRHRTVSGTLVFKRVWNHALARHELHASYVQNPFAQVWLNPSIFPVSRYYVVTKVAMEWRERKHGT